MTLASLIMVGSLLCLGSGAQDDGMKPLFNGKSLDGWIGVNGKEGNWVAENGLLVTLGNGGGWLSTKEIYSDFQVSLEYKLQAGGNSGLLIRTPHVGATAYQGIEIQILDNEDPRYAQLKPFQYCGSVYGVVAAPRGHVKPAGQWNSMEVTAQGSKVQVVLNGVKVVDTDLAEHPESVPTHPGILRTDGYIGLQSHSEPVEFRNIQIKTLK